MLVVVSAMRLNAQLIKFAVWQFETSWAKEPVRYVRRHAQRRTQRDGPRKQETKSKKPTNKMRFGGDRCFQRTSRQERER